MLRITKTGFARLLLRNSGRFQVGGIVDDDFIGLPPIGVTPPVVIITIPEGNTLSVATVENGTIATLTSPDGTFLSETTISTISGVTTTTIIDATLLSTATVTNANTNSSVVVTIKSKATGGLVIPYNFTLEDEFGATIPHTLSTSITATTQLWVEPGLSQIPNNGFVINNYLYYLNEHYDIGDTFTLTHDVTKTVRNVRIGWFESKFSVDAQIQVGGQTVLVAATTSDIIGSGGTIRGTSIQEAMFEGGDVVTVTSIQPIDLSTNSQTIVIENWVENTKDTTLNYLTSGADPQSVTTITELDTGVIISVTTVSADDVNDPNRALMRGFRALEIGGEETQEAKYSAPDPVTGFITVATSFADGTQELALATSTGIVLNVSNVSAEVDGVRTTQDFNAENVHTSNTTHTTDPLTGLVDSVTLDLSNNVIETKTSSFADGVTTVIVRDSNGSVVSTTTSSTMNGDTIEEIVYATGYIVRTNQKNNIVFKSEVTMPLNESNEIIKTVRGKLTGETTVITLDSQNVETQRTTISVDPITLDFVSRVDILQQTDGTSVDNTYDVDNQLQTTEYTESLGNGSTRRVKADANGYSVLSHISQTTVNGVETLIETDPTGGLIATTTIETTDGEMVVERTDGTSLHVTTTTTNT